MPQQYVMSEPALREMFDLPDNDRDRVLRQLRRLADDPLHHGLNVKKMHGWEGLYRLRIGDWRVFFTRGSLVEVQGVRRRQDTTYSATQGPTDAEVDPYELSGLTVDLPTPAPDSGEDAAPEDTRTDEALARGTSPTPDGALPHRLTPELLRSWHVPSEHHDALASCRTVDDLCELDVDARVIDHVFDMLLPADVEQARAYGMRGTPAFVVYGRDTDAAGKMMGAQPYERFQTAIRRVENA